MVMMVWQRSLTAKLKDREVQERRRLLLWLLKTL